jgi:hypothetical protein
VDRACICCQGQIEEIRLGSTTTKVESTIKIDTATGNDTKPTATKREPDSIGSVPRRQDRAEK